MMWIKSFYFKRIALIVATAILLISAVPAESMAYIVGAEGAVEATRAVDMEKAQSILESRLVKMKLTQLGLSAEEINTRLSKLTDAELHRFASTIDSLYPGQGAIGVLIGVLIVIALVMVLLKLTNKKIVIK
ncbi:MAG: PA2779 family protein [Thermodesulfobacteriota bacterium]